MKGVREVHYDILTVGLKMSCKAGWERFMKSKKHKMCPKTETYYKDNYDSFYASYREFKKKANIREIEIDAEKHSKEEMARKILSAKAS